MVSITTSSTTKRRSGASAGLSTHSGRREVDRQSGPCPHRHLGAIAQSVEHRLCKPFVEDSSSSGSTKGVLAGVLIGRRHQPSRDLARVGGDGAQLSRRETQANGGLATSGSLLVRSNLAVIAQLAECILGKDEAPGSIPGDGSKINLTSFRPRSEMDWITTLYESVIRRSSRREGTLHPKREEARQLRRDGKSYSYIERMLGIGKGTLSYMLRDIKLTQEQWGALHPRKKERPKKSRLLRKQPKHEPMVGGRDPIVKRYGPYYHKSTGYMYYVDICISGRRKMNYVHREVVRQQKGRNLRTSEIVHHKNGGKIDNDKKNLKITDAVSHAKQHARPVVWIEFKCALLECGKTVRRRRSKTHAVHGRAMLAFCSHVCRGRHYGAFNTPPHGRGGGPTHGTASAYSYHKCRCDLCRKNNTDRAREYRKSTSP